MKEKTSMSNFIQSVESIRPSLYVKFLSSIIRRIWKVSFYEKEGGRLNWLFSMHLIKYDAVKIFDMICRVVRRKCDSSLYVDIPTYWTNCIIYYNFLFYTTIHRFMVCSSNFFPLKFLENCRKNVAVSNIPPQLNCRYNHGIVNILWEVLLCPIKPILCINKAHQHNRLEVFKIAILLGCFSFSI